MKLLISGILSLGAVPALAGGFICTSLSPSDNQEKTLAVTAYIPLENGTAGRKATLAISQGSLNNIIYAEKIVIGKKNETETHYEYSNAEREFNLVFDVDFHQPSVPGTGKLSSRFGGFKDEDEEEESPAYVTLDVNCWASVH